MTAPGAGARPGPPAEPARAVEVRNEFAAVLVSLDNGANAPRLRVQDLESGAVALLDAFVLRSLCLLPPRAFQEVCRATVPGEPDGARGRRMPGGLRRGGAARARRAPPAGAPPA